MAEFCKDCFEDWISPIKFEDERLVMTEEYVVCERCGRLMKCVSAVTFNIAQEEEIKVYRLEDSEGNGYWFYKDGRCKTDPNLVFDDIGYSAFKNISSFNKSQEYRDFYNSDDYDLYEITLSEIYKEAGYGDEVIFLEEDVVSKVKIDKPSLDY